MIVLFDNKDTEKIWSGERVKLLSTELQEIGRRKLRMLNNSQNLTDFKDFYSIRLNNKWRIIFRWKNGNAFNVQIIDYH